MCAIMPLIQMRFSILDCWVSCIFCIYFAFGRRLWEGAALNSLIGRSSFVFVWILIVIIVFQSHFHLATSRVYMVCIYQCLTILSFPKRYGFPKDSINSKIVRLVSPRSLRSCLLARSRNQRQSFNRTFSTTHNVQ